MVGMLNAMEDTMSDANIKLLQDAFDAFKRGDIPAVLDAMAPDVSWGLLGREEDIPMLGIRRGKAGAAEFFRLLNEVQEITAFEPRAYLAAQDKVFAWGRTAWIMRGNGVAGDNDWLVDATFRDGKLTAFHGYLDTAMLTAAYRAAPAAKRAANR
jgi:ketosteroid isomerase-like protein